MSTAVKKKKKKKRIKIGRLIGWLLVLALIGLAVFFLTAKRFELREIEVVGNRYLSEEEIAEDIGLTPGTHLVRYMLKSLVSQPEVSLKLKSLDLYTYWPDKVRIEVTEENFVGYIYFQGRYLWLNRQGIVIDSTAEKEIALPEIEGVEVGSFALGQAPVTKDNEPFSAVLEAANILGKYGLEEKVTRINVRHLDDMLLYTDLLEIRLGDSAQIDLKINALGEFLKAYPDRTGILHLEDIENQVYLETK